MQNASLWIVLGIVVLGVLVMAVVVVIKSLRDNAVAAVARDFKNVLAMTSRERQEAMIKSWMQSKKCSRIEAMRLAVEDDELAKEALGNDLGRRRGYSDL